MLADSRTDILHFNPRSSCEERLKAVDEHNNYSKFQSTLLMRGATWYQALVLVLS